MPLFGLGNQDVPPCVCGETSLAVEIEVNGIIELIYNPDGSHKATNYDEYNFKPIEYGKNETGDFVFHCPNCQRTRYGVYYPPTSVVLELT